MGLAGAGAGAALAAASTAEAGVILSPTAVVSNSMGDAGFAVDMSSVIDQSGLSSGFTSGSTDYSTYLLTSPTHSTLTAKSGQSWRSASGNTTGNVIFDLGDIYNIERVAIWQGNESDSAFSDENIDGIALETSLDSAFTTPSAAGSFNVPESTGVSAYPVNDFDLTDSAGRYVRLTLQSNHGDLSFIRFGEIAFDVTAVPEPSSGVMMLVLLGIGGLSLLGRRLRRFLRRPV